LKGQGLLQDVEKSADWALLSFIDDPDTLISVFKQLISIEITQSNLSANIWSGNQFHVTLRIPRSKI